MTPVITNPRSSKASFSDVSFSNSEGGFYTSKQWDEDIELYYFNARWYDPETGRFITEDPIRDGTGWYSYVGNHPMGFVDPTGLDREIFTNNFLGMIAHAAIQDHLVKNYIGGRAEVKIGDSGRADYLHPTKNNMEIYEIKPISNINNPNADLQLQNYVNDARARSFESQFYRNHKMMGKTPIEGEALLSRIHNERIPLRLLLPNEGFVNAEIQMITSPIDHPGMIYYKIFRSERSREIEFSNVKKAGVYVGLLSSLAISLETLGSLNPNGAYIDLDSLEDMSFSKFFTKIDTSKKNDPWDGMTLAEMLIDKIENRGNFSSIDSNLLDIANYKYYIQSLQAGDSSNINQNHGGGGPPNSNQNNGGGSPKQRAPKILQNL